MTDLKEIPAAHLLATARSFSNLRFHRVYVLEGLARTAHRNLRHMVEARDRVALRVPIGRAGGQQEWINEIQAEMLRDHGILHEDARLRMPRFSTTLPVELYCAALSAEAEFLRKPPSHLSALIDDDAKRLLAEHQELIDQLRGFRDGFLKPQASTVLTKERLFGGEFFNGVPALLTVIDRIMARMRQRLRADVESLLAQLPDEQALLCRFMHIEQCRQNSLMLKSLPVQDAMKRAMTRVLQDARRHSAEIDRLELSEQASSKAHMVIELLDSVSAYDEMAFLGDIAEYDTLQPPFEAGFLTPFLETQLDHKNGISIRGRTAAHIAEHINHYMRIMLVSRVAANEVHHLIRHVASGQQIQLIDDMISASSNVPATQAVRITSLHLAQAALLTPILRLYQSVREENPHAAVPSLDQIVNDKDGFAALRTFRNAVFHVERRPTSAEQRDNALLRKVSSTEFLSDLTAGVEEFLAGIRLGAVI